MQKTVLAFGETLWDLLPSGPKLGGAPFNFAFRVNSLGDRGLMISRLGRDELGDRAAAQIAEAQQYGLDGFGRGVACLADFASDGSQPFVE